MFNLYFVVKRFQHFLSTVIPLWTNDFVAITLVVTVRNPMDALATLRMQKFDLVVTDLHMPVMNGLELQKEVEEEFKLPVISECHFTSMILILNNKPLISSIKCSS